MESEGFFQGEESIAKDGFLLKIEQGFFDKELLHKSIIARFNLSIKEVIMNRSRKLQC